MLILDVNYEHELWISVYTIIVDARHKIGSFNETLDPAEEADNAVKRFRLRLYVPTQLNGG